VNDPDTTRDVLAAFIFKGACIGLVGLVGEGVRFGSPLSFEESALFESLVLEYSSVEEKTFAELLSHFSRRPFFS